MICKKKYLWYPALLYGPRGSRSFSAAPWPVYKNVEFGLVASDWSAGSCLFLVSNVFFEASRAFWKSVSASSCQMMQKKKSICGTLLSFTVLKALGLFRQLPGQCTEMLKLVWWLRIGLQVPASSWSPTFSSRLRGPSGSPCPRLLSNDAKKKKYLWCPALLYGPRGAWSLSAAPWPVYKNVESGLVASDWSAGSCLFLVRNIYFEASRAFWNSVSASSYQMMRASM